MPQGNREGHPFYGNQWTGGRGGSVGYRRVREDRGGPQGNQEGHPFYGNQWTSGRGQPSRDDDDRYGGYDRRRGDLGYDDRVRRDPRDDDRRFGGYEGRRRGGETSAMRQDRDPYGRFAGPGDDERRFGGPMGRRPGTSRPPEREDYGRFSGDDDYRRSMNPDEDRYRRRALESGPMRPRDDWRDARDDEPRYGGRGFYRDDDDRRFAGMDRRRGEARMMGPDRDDYGRLIDDRDRDRGRSHDDDEDRYERSRQDRDDNRFNIDDDDRSGRTWGGRDRDRDREDGPNLGGSIGASDREPYPYPHGRLRQGRFS